MLVSTLFAFSCTQDEVYQYNGLDYAGVIINDLDVDVAASHTFLTDPTAQTADMSIKVTISGKPVNKDRYFDVEVVEDKSDYKPEQIKSIECMIPADSTWGNIKLTINRTADMDTKEFYVTYTLKATEDFPETGLNNGRARFIYSNVVGMPAFWTEYYSIWLGQYSDNFYTLVSSLNTNGGSDLSKNILEEHQEKLDELKTNGNITVYGNKYATFEDWYFSSYNFYAKSNPYMDVLKMNVNRELSNKRGTPDEYKHNDGTSIVLPR